MSRKQRRAKRRNRLINCIYVSIDYQDKRPDTVWLTFNALDPHPFRQTTDLLTVCFHTAFNEGEAYVSKNFPGITYKKTKPPLVLTVTTTGRGPSMQQIPLHTPEGTLLKKLIRDKKWSLCGYNG